MNWRKNKKTRSDLPKLTVYTDGSCFPNPGPGGWAALMFFNERYPFIASGYSVDTTNNRMEMAGLLAALDLLMCESTEIDLYSDSDDPHPLFRFERAPEMEGFSSG